MGAISQVSLQRSAAQLVAKAKRPCHESIPIQQEEVEFWAAEEAAYDLRPPSSSAPSSSSSRVEASLVAILDQIQQMHADFGSRLDTPFDEVCQINTRVSRIAHRQSCLGGFAPSSERDPSAEPSASGDDDGDDASGSEYDDEMSTSQ